MESIEKAREAIRKDEFTNANLAKAFGAGESAYMPETLEVVLKAIEAEIAERYMELPLDADGVPIHVGDSIKYPNGRWDSVRFITVNDNAPTFNERGWIASKCHHVKPRTLEDVLADFCRESTGASLEETNELLRRYAAEIRELLGGA